MSKDNGRLLMTTKLQRELSQRIIAGVYKPHQFMPSERELAKDLGTSRVSIGKALEAMEQKGLVERLPGRGTRVLPISQIAPQLRIGIVRVHFPVKEQVERQDVLRTLQGITDAFDQMDYRYEVVTLPQRFIAPSDQCLASFRALLFLDGCYCSETQLARLQHQQIPLVVAKLEQDIDVNATWVDHCEPMRQAVENFVNLGHERIAFVGREPGYAHHGKAREGYLTGLRDAGLPIEESLIGVCGKTDALSAYFATRGILTISNPPTAIVAARDSIAEGVCRAIEEVGLTIGQDVSVIGFDDLTWPEGREFLTTFRETCYEMGAAAAQMLVERIVGGWHPPEKRKFETPFVLRRSAAPLPSNTSPLKLTTRAKSTFVREETL